MKILNALNYITYWHKDEGVRKKKNGRKTFSMIKANIKHDFKIKWQVY